MTNLLVCGRNDSHQLSSILPDANIFGLPVIQTPKEIELNSLKVRCISTACDHTVVVDSEGRVFGIGDNRNFQFGSDERIIHKDPVHVELPDRIVWASSGHSYTLYLTEDGRIIYSGKSCQKKVIKSLLKYNIIFIAGSQDKQCAIDEKGDIFLLDRDILNGTPTKIHLSHPVFDISMSNFITIAVDIEGRCYGNKYIAMIDGPSIASPDNNELYEIPSLVGFTITRVYAHGRSACALSKDGRAFMFGANEFGELGVCSEEKFISKFTPALVQENIVSVGLGNNFTVFVTENGNVYGCGKNTMSSLMLGAPSEIVTIPQKSSFVRNQAKYVTCGNYHTILISKESDIQHVGEKKLCPIDTTNSNMNKEKSQVSALYDFLGFCE